jgi:hypothetical protein
MMIVIQHKFCNPSHSVERGGNSVGGESPRGGDVVGQ